MGMLSSLAPRFKRLTGSGAWILAAVCCLFFLNPAAADAADVIEALQFDGRWPDASPGNLAADRQTGSLFLASGNILLILDEPGFHEKSRLSLDAGRGISGLAADPGAKRIYAALGADGMAVVDVSDATNPAQTAVLAMDPNKDPVRANGIDYLDNRVYLADNNFGLRIIDVSNPDNPNQAGAYEQVSRYTDEEGEAASSSGGHVNVRVAALGNQKLAFVLDQFLGLRIFDVTIDAAPEPLGAYDMRSAKYFGQLSEVVDVTVDVDRKYAYVTDATYGVTILDFSKILPGADPGAESEITKAGQIETPGSAAGLHLSNDSRTLFVADGSKGLLVADVSDPTADAFGQTDSPTYPTELVKAQSYAATGAYAAVAFGSRVYLANAKDGLARLSPAAGALAYAKTGAYDAPAAASAIFLDECYAYVLDSHGPREGLRIIALEDEVSGRSELKGFLPTPGNATAAAVHESFAYVTDGTEGIAVINISEKSAPELENTFYTNGHARDIKIWENGDDTATAYIADSSQGLVIAEVMTEGENSGGLSEIGRYPLENARALAVYEYEKENENRRCALLVNRSGLTLLDVTDPEKPEECGFLDTSGEAGEALDVGVKYPYAIVANGPEGVLLVDITDPSTPERIDTFPAEGSARAVFLQASYIHTALGDRGLLVLGISDTEPAELTPIDIDPAETVENPYFNTPGYAADVFVSETGPGRFTYMADTHGGFLSFSHEDRLGGGINEQPFTESPDDTGCFIGTAAARYKAVTNDLRWNR